MFFLIAGSIIGPAMAGPTGPFATALLVGNCGYFPALHYCLYANI